MKKLLFSFLVTFTLVALSSAQFVKRPETEQAQTSTVGSGNEIEIVDPSRARIADEDPQQTMDPGDRVIRFGDDEPQKQVVDEQERLRQEKALKERDRKWIKSVLDNPGMAGDHGWAKKRLNVINQELVVINKRLNDVTYEMRRGLNKHAKQIEDLNTKVDGIWDSDKAKAFKASLKQEILQELQVSETSEEPQEIANDSSWSPLWLWIGIPALALFVWLLIRRRRKKSP